MGSAPPWAGVTPAPSEKYKSQNDEDAILLSGSFWGLGGGNLPLPSGEVVRRHLCRARVRARGPSWMPPPSPAPEARPLPRGEVRRGSLPTAACSWPDAERRTHWIYGHQYRRAYPHSRAFLFHQL